MVKNQHYIPEFYLKRFGKGEKIDAYDIKNNKFITNTNVNNFACRRFFYDTDPDNIRDVLHIYKEIGYASEEEIENKLKEPQFIEKTFSELESRTSAYLDKFEEDISLINDEKFLSMLFIFMDTLSLRIASYRNSLENITEQTSAWLKSLNISEIKNYPLHLDPKEIAKQSQLNSILSLPRAYKKALNFFDCYDFFVGVNNTDVDFIISDNPLLYFLQGFNDICFPINPKLAIIMQANAADEAHKICNAKPDLHKRIFLKAIDVIKYNTLQEYSNGNFLFGSETALRFYLAFSNYTKSYMKGKNSI